MRALPINKRRRALAVLAGLALSLSPIGPHMRGVGVGIDGMAVWAKGDGRSDVRSGGAQPPFDAAGKVGGGARIWISETVPGGSADGPEPVVEALLHYRQAVLANDLGAAAAALLQTSGPTTCGDIARVHRILGIRPEDTKLSAEAIAEEVARLRVMASRSQPASAPAGEPPQ